LQGLLQSVSGEDMERAVQAIIDARSVYVAGYRRSFPVASYLAYSLLQAGKRTVFVDGVGGLEQQQIRLMDQGRPADRDQLPALCERSRRRGRGPRRTARARSWRSATVWSARSPSAPIWCCRCANRKCAGFRSLSASMCLAQAMIINYAFEINRTPAPGGGQENTFQPREGMKHTLQN
jgi:hypothetical protein